MDKSDLELEVEEIQRKRDEVLDRGKIDAIDAFNAVMVICDQFDVDPTTVMQNISDKYANLDNADFLLVLDIPTQLIWNLIEISQSNPPRCISDLIEVIGYEDQIDQLIS